MTARHTVLAGRALLLLGVLAAWQWGHWVLGDLFVPSLLAVLQRLHEVIAGGEIFGHLAVTHRHAWQAGSLAVEHRDPFDRMLAAQAQLEGLVLVSVDPVFAGEFGQRVLW